VATGHRSVPPRTHLGSRVSTLTKVRVRNSVRFSPDSVGLGDALNGASALGAAGVVRFRCSSRASLQPRLADGVDGDCVRPSPRVSAARPAPRQTRARFAGVEGFE
jgi:hypothetical protein